jgi:hypothetical protein
MGNACSTDGSEEMGHIAVVRESEGCAVTQAVSRRLATAAARVRAPRQVMWDLW